MARKTRKRRRTTPPADARAAEALTAMWMLAVMSVVGCEVGAAVVAGIWTATGNEHADMLWRLLWFASLVVGLVVLAMTFAVRRVRRDHPPPTLVVVVAIVASILPPLAMIVAWVI